MHGGRSGPCGPGRRPIRYGMVACFHHMVSHRQSIIWRSPSLSRSNTWPLSSSWNTSAHLALVFGLWRYPPGDAVLTPAISPCPLPWSNVKPVQHTWQSWVSNRSCPSPRLAADQGCWAQSTQGCVVEETWRSQTWSQCPSHKPLGHRATHFASFSNKISLIPVYTHLPEFKYSFIWLEFEIFKNTHFFYAWSGSDDFVERLPGGLCVTVVNKLINKWRTMEIIDQASTLGRGFSPSK